MIGLLQIPCVTRCSGKLSTQNSCTLISADTVPLMKGIMRRPYDFLISRIKGYIARGKQERLLKDRERAVKISLSSNKTMPALEDDVKTAVPTKTKKEDAAAASSAGDPPRGKPKAKAKSEAASVLPTPSPKSHADKNKKGKGKGGKGRSSSPTDKKKIFCNYFFNKGLCNKGDKCLYSHSQKVYDAKMKDKKGRSRSRDSSGRKSKGKFFISWTEEEGYAGSGKRVHVLLEASASFYMQICHHQHPLKEPAARTRRRKRFPLPLIPSLTATLKMQRIIPRRG